MAKKINLRDLTVNADREAREVVFKLAGLKGGQVTIIINVEFRERIPDALDFQAIAKAAADEFTRQTA